MFGPLQKQPQQQQQTITQKPNHLLTSASKCHSVPFWNSLSESLADGKQATPAMASTSFFLL